MTIRILVTGSREWTDWERLETELRRVVVHYHQHSSIMLVHGDCPTGADRMAREWVERSKNMFNIDHEPHPYRSDLGKRGGPIRNGEMVALGADLCVAFWNGKREGSGTLDCFAQAVAAGIPVRIIPARVLR